MTNEYTIIIKPVKVRDQIIPKVELKIPDYYLILGRPDGDCNLWTTQKIGFVYTPLKHKGHHHSFLVTYDYEKDEYEAPEFIKSRTRGPDLYLKGWTEYHWL